MMFPRLNPPSARADLLIVLGMVIMVLGVIQPLQDFPVAWSVFVVALGLAFLGIGIFASDQAEREP